MSKNEIPVNHLLGFVELANSRCPHPPETQMGNGFRIAQSITGLYVIEIALKHAHQKLDKEPECTHNLEALLSELSKNEKKRISQKYHEFVNYNMEYSYKIAKSPQALLGFFGKSPITYFRYFWDKYENVPVFPGEIANLASALLVTLCDHKHDPLPKRYDTKYLPMPDIPILRKDLKNCS